MYVHKVFGIPPLVMTGKNVYENNFTGNGYVNIILHTTGNRYVNISHYTLLVMDMLTSHYTLLVMDMLTSHYTLLVMDMLTVKRNELFSHTLKF